MYLYLKVSIIAASLILDLLVPKCQSKQWLIILQQSAVCTWVDIDPNKLHCGADFMAEVKSLVLARPGMGNFSPGGTLSCEASSTLKLCG